MAESNTKYKALEIMKLVTEGTVLYNSMYTLTLNEKRKPIIVSNHTKVSNEIFDWFNLSLYNWSKVA